MNSNSRIPSQTFQMDLEDYPSFDCVKTWFSAWQSMIFKYNLNGYAISFWILYNEHSIVNMIKLSAYDVYTHDIHTEVYNVTTAVYTRAHAL